MSTENDIKYLESRLKDNPKSIIFARLADLYLDQNRVDEAIQICTGGVKHNPAYVTGHYVLAKAYILSEDYENAETALKQVISHDREFLSAHKLLGDLMRKLGWENKAAAHYRDVVQIDPLEEKVRDILDLLDESADDEETSQPDSEPAEASFDLPEADNSEVADWMSEIKEVFPEEIKPESESTPSEPLISEGSPSLAESEAEMPKQPDSVETLSNLGLDEQSALDQSTEDCATATQSETDGPAISETPEFFTIKDDESGSVDTEEIAAEFLAPEQISESSENVGEEVVSDEVEISEIREPIEEIAAESEPASPEDNPSEPKEVESASMDSDEDGSDFAQALDSLEAMDSPGDAGATSETVAAGDSSSVQETDLNESEQPIKSVESEPADEEQEDEPLIHEDSGLESVESKAPVTAEPSPQDGITQSENTETDHVFEWEISEDTAQTESVDKSDDETEHVVEKAEPAQESMPEESIITEEPDEQETDKKEPAAESIPQIQMTPPEPEQTESFEPQDLDLGIREEPPEPTVEEPTQEDSQAEDKQPESEAEKKAPEPESSATDSSAETEPPLEQSPPPEETPAESEANSEEKEKTAKKSAAKIVTPTLGEIYTAQGQYDKALSVFEELLQKDPDNERYKEKIADLKNKIENPL